MKKVIFTALAISLFFLSGCAESIEDDQHVYLKHFDKTNSNLIVDCKKDEDCVLKNLTSGCGELASININNKEKEIEIYNKKEGELLEGVFFKCGIPPSIEDHQAVCIDNICGYREK
jgi:hypothetical protein